MNTGAIDALERMLEESDDADDVLRRSVSILVADPGIVWAGVGLLEGGEIVLGPAAGSPDEARRARVPITFHHALVGELWADGEPDRALLEQVASRIAPHVLIGWDTGGEAWEP